MKIIGTLDTKDDADLLPEVLDQAKGMFDAVYAYDDGSIDNTYEILKNHPVVSKLWHRDEFSEEEHKRYIQHRRGWPLEQVKKDFPYETEDIWVVRVEGDRFFMNQDPKEIVDRAIRANMDSRSGVMMDFRRHRADGWDEMSDTFPNWHCSLRKLQRWFIIEDIHDVIAFKVEDHIDYGINRYPRPWPRGTRKNDLNKHAITKDMAFFEHHGKRSPNYYYWATQSGSRIIGKKAQRQHPDYDYTSPLTIYQTMPKQFRPYKLFPYTTFDQSVGHWIWLQANTDLFDNKQYQRYYYWGLEQAYIQSGKQLPLKTDT